MSHLATNGIAGFLPLFIEKHLDKAIIIRYWLKDHSDDADGYGHLDIWKLMYKLYDVDYANFQECDEKRAITLDQKNMDQKNGIKLFKDYIANFLRHLECDEYEQEIDLTDKKNRAKLAIEALDYISNNLYQEDL